MPDSSGDGTGAGSDGFDHQAGPVRTGLRERLRRALAGSGLPADVRVRMAEVRDADGRLPGGVYFELKPMGGDRTRGPRRLPTPMGVNFRNSQGPHHVQLNLEFPPTEADPNYLYWVLDTRELGRSARAAGRFKQDAGTDARGGLLTVGIGSHGSQTRTARGDDVTLHWIVPEKQFSQYPGGLAATFTVSFEGERYRGALVVEPDDLPVVDRFGTRAPRTSSSGGRPSAG